jgi:hypothetical protein
MNPLPSIPVYYGLYQQNDCQTARVCDTTEKAELMKVVVISLVVSLTLSSQLFAVLRPRFPVKADPPYRGDLISIGDDAQRNPTKHSPRTAGK